MDAILESFGIEWKKRGTVESKIGTSAFLSVLILFRDSRIDLSHELVCMRLSIPLGTLGLAATPARPLVRARFGSIGEKDIWEHRLANLLVDFVNIKPLTKERREYILSYRLTREQ